MRFEVTLLKDKLKSLQISLQIINNLLKIKVIPLQVLFIYVSMQNQIRILIDRDEAPIILVLQNSMFTNIKSSSKHANNGDNNVCTVGFIIKNGLQFIQSLHFISKQQTKLISSEEQKMIKLKIQKDKEYRYLQVKSPNRNLKLEIEKPKTNQNQLFSYHWIDGVRKHSAYFQLNPTHFLQVLNPVWRYQTVQPFQYLPQKFVHVKLELQNRVLVASVKTLTSQIISKSYLNNHIAQQTLDQQNQLIIIPQEKQMIQVKRQNSLQKGTILHYQIRFSDCQQIAALLKGQTSFIVDQQNRLVIHFSQQGLFQCQILLAQWIQFIKSEKQDGLYFKVEENQQLVKRYDQ